MNDTDLAYAPIRAQADALRDREVSSVELTTLYLDRLRKFGPELGAVAHLTENTALDAAKKADLERARGQVRSLLHGIPYGIKDLFATAGDPTEWGSPTHAGQVFDYDSRVVELLRDAGAVMLGKLSMIELAGGGGYRYGNASSTGPCRTPWNLEHWAGGSSSGCGAATAAGLVGFAIGSETMGSIMCPSSFCGITGLRPTYGRVSRYGAMDLSFTMDKVGPMARSAEDCDTILGVISGIDKRDPTTKKTSAFASNKLKSVKGLRVAVVRPTFHEDDLNQKAKFEFEKLFEDALTKLEDLGVAMRDGTLPDLPVEDAASTIIKVEAGAALEEVIRNADRLATLVDEKQRDGLLAALEIPANKYVRSLKVLIEAQAAMSEWFSDYDAIVAPGMLKIAAHLSEKMEEHFVGSDNKVSAMGNICGLPSVCLPIGFGHANLPISMQFVGNIFSESTILSLGAAYQSCTDWHQKRPQAFT